MSIYAQKKPDPLSAIHITTYTWNDKIKDFKEFSNMDCHIMFFLLEDRIRVKDANNSVYYIVNSELVHETDIDYLKMSCYDESGKDCKMVIGITKNGDIRLIAITYSNVRYVYTMTTY